MYKKLTRRELNRMEQRTLRMSVYAIVAMAVAGIGWGLYIGSEAVMLDGFFSLTSLLGSGLYLLAARLVERPADRHFQYGYAHIEPLVNSFNNLILLLMCLYALFNGLEGLRTGGNTVDPGEVVIYSVLSATACMAVWWYERRVAARCDSQLVRNDAREWMISTLFSLVTLVGFTLVWLLPEPWSAWWARYADSALLALMALLLLPVPAKVLLQNMREVLRMANPDDEVAQRVRAAMVEVSGKYDIASYSTHIAKTGRQYVVEINILVGEDFELRSVPELDTLRSRIWDAIGLPLERAWLGILFTADRRWS